MRRFFTFILSVLVVSNLCAQQNESISFMHEGMQVNGIFSKPAESGQSPVIIFVPGSGANNKDGTLSMVGGNSNCLYPNLVGQTLTPYKDLGDQLANKGYAVLRYDKLEYSYPNNLGNITFNKLWLPALSAIDYVKSRNDVESDKIILLGHSEGSTLISYMARQEDIHALISIGGPRSTLDSLLQYQLVKFAQMCAGDTIAAKNQAASIKQYFINIRNGNYNSSTPPLFGVTADVWDDYIQVADSVSINYNIANRPTLFIGLENDLNVPISELQLFENEINIEADFWMLHNLNHYMTTNDHASVPTFVGDTIHYWLENFMLGLDKNVTPADEGVQIFPNPAQNKLNVRVPENFNLNSIEIYNLKGQVVYKQAAYNTFCNIDLSDIISGVYVVKLQGDNRLKFEKFIKK